MTSSLGAEAIAEHVNRVQEQGYTVLPALYSQEQCDLLRSELTELWAENGRLPLYKENCGYVAEHIEIWALGLVFHKLLEFKPHLASKLLVPETAAVLNGLFPEGAYIEKTGAVLSDTTRPFFDWHTHVGGIDDELYRKQGWTPQFDRAQRVVVLIYLNELEPDGGEVRVWPRRQSDPNVEPPYATQSTEWAGQVKLTAPAGSVVIIEQCTWHCALTRTIPGVRMFIGAYYASADAAATFDVDESLLSLDGKAGLLQGFRPTEDRSVAARGLPEGLDSSHRAPSFGSSAAPPPSEGGPIAGLLEGVADTFDARLLKVRLEPRRATCQFLTSDGRSFDLVLVPRNERRPALRRSRSFNILYENVIGSPNDALRALVKGAVDAVIERDSGSMELSANPREADSVGGP